ncbi:hypothetical protein FBY33_0091 [Arthrobacter sp. SLBN-112]|jgi:hypothetical protein|uniref:hypothetical protein n=1 Tax=Arthrobacter sp. SLBN-112 TaxID=2768452 RepID=UPI0011528104|nr:hypothetical protein [Arthrobacter sp. SLBN-112]TQJ38099.1 hypothetical protein FBY33_0091 [Arthrobacter sp. SLBN-112]
MPALNSSTARAAAGPCLGAPAADSTAYGETRQFVDAQAWWMPDTDQANNSITNTGHVHLGACIPERETISSGNLTVNVRVVLHDNPGTANYVAMVFKTPDRETTVQKCYLRATTPNFSCAGPASSGTGDFVCNGTCERWVTFSWPISAFNHSGLQDVRFRGFVLEPDGNEMQPSFNWQVNIQNGKSPSDVTRNAFLRGKAWYTHALYCESSVRNVPIPDGPVSGIWEPTVGLTTHPGGSRPATHSFIAIDPDFHAVPANPGRVLWDSAGPYGPEPFGSAPIAIDTTTMANGVHKLHLRTSCRDNTLGSTNSGVTVIPFTVAN